MLSLVLETPFVAFSVSHGRTESYESGEIVKFNHDISNSGFWNEEGNVFTCPLDGYYLFTVSFYKNSGSSSYDSFHTRIFLDGVAQVGLYFQGTEDDRGMHSSAVIAHCKQATFASVQTASSGTMYGSNSYRTVFSGVLLAEAPAPEPEE